MKVNQSKSVVGPIVCNSALIRACLNFIRDLQHAVRQSVSSAFSQNVVVDTVARKYV